MAHYLFPEAICGRTKHSDHKDPWRMHFEQDQILQTEHGKLIEQCLYILSTPKIITLHAQFWSCTILDFLRREKFEDRTKLLLVQGWRALWHGVVLVFDATPPIPYPPQYKRTSLEKSCFFRSLNWRHYPYDYHIPNSHKVPSWTEEEISH